MLVFGAAALFVFLVLAANYESWKLPLSVVLIVPMCLLASVTGLLFRGMPIDILAQIGFVVLVGLAAKNAILIVEFARQAQDAGSKPADAAVSAARRRLRPILMTSLAFILGVAPLVVATGAGAEMRQSLGTAVFGGHARRHRLRPDLHAGLLHADAADRRRPQPRAGRAASAGPGVREPRSRGVTAAAGPLRAPSPPPLSARRRPRTPDQRPRRSLQVLSRNSNADVRSSAVGSCSDVSAGGFATVRFRARARRYQTVGSVPSDPSGALPVGRMSMV